MRHDDDPAALADIPTVVDFAHQILAMQGKIDMLEDHVRTLAARNRDAMVVKWVATDDRLPAVGFASPTILFLVDGKPYCGHYHLNGWFYCEERVSARGDMSMARGAKDARMSGAFSGTDLDDLPVATHWAYLREESGR